MFNTRVVKMAVGDQVFFGLEIEQKALESLDLVDGEILKTTVTDSSITLEKTGVIVNETDD